MSCKSFCAAASLGAWLSLASCGPGDYLYTPSTMTLTSAEPAQSRTIAHPFPPDSPQGDIRLATSGIEKPSAGVANAVRLRMILRNRGEEPWVVDTREQKLVLAKGSDERPVATPTPLPALPAVIEIRPKQSAIIDLSFAVPPGVSKTSVIPAFDAVWTVHVGDRAITTITTFERLVARRAPQDAPWPP